MYPWSYIFVVFLSDKRYRLGVIYSLHAGRCTNMFMILHGSSGPDFSSLAFTSSSGLIMIDSSFIDNTVTRGVMTTSLQDWGRPVLMLFGQPNKALDNTTRVKNLHCKERGPKGQPVYEGGSWPWHVGLALDSAELAVKAGPR